MSIYAAMKESHGSEESMHEHQFVNTQRACNYYQFGRKDGRTEYCYICNEPKHIHSFKYVCGYCGSILNENWLPIDEEFDPEFQYQKVEGACCISKQRLGDFRSRTNK